MGYVLGILFILYDYILMTPYWLRFLSSQLLIGLFAAKVMGFLGLLGK